MGVGQDCRLAAQGLAVGGQWTPGQAASETGQAVEAVAAREVLSRVELDAITKDVEAAKGNPVSDRTELEQVRATFQDYYVLARATSERMIAGNRTESVVAFATRRAA